MDYPKRVDRKALTSALPFETVTSKVSYFPYIYFLTISTLRSLLITNLTVMKIPLRYTVNAGVRIQVSESFDVVPHAIYIRQQKAEEKAIGGYSEFKLLNDKAFILGAMYRFNDAAIANVGYHVNNLIIGASYDFNTSSLNRATFSRGGIELSISYVFKKRFSEPEAICPRL